MHEGFNLWLPKVRVNASLLLSTVRVRSIHHKKARSRSSCVEYGQGGSSEAIVSFLSLSVALRTESLLRSILKLGKLVQVFSSYPVDDFYRLINVTGDCLLTSVPAPQNMATTVKVTNVSKNATEKDLWDFFAFSGEILSISMQPAGEGDSQTAHVTFQEAKALDTALLLTGAQIVDLPIHVEAAPQFQPPENASLLHSPSVDSLTDQKTSASASATYDRAQAVMADMLAKGYVLGKDAMARARTYDEKHQLSKNAGLRAAMLRDQARETAANLDRKMGISQKFSAGATQLKDSVRTVDERYHVAEKTRQALSVAGEKVNEAGAALWRNKYFVSTTVWLSGAYAEVTKAAGEVNKKATETLFHPDPDGSPANDLDDPYHLESVRIDSQNRVHQPVTTPAVFEHGDAATTPSQSTEAAKPSAHFSLDDVGPDDLMEATPRPVSTSGPAGDSSLLPV
eukprot:jgi/Mesen1/10499/ME000083S10003